ncbi:MAG: hypothetical protein ABJH63_12610 [Rhizobiaceae bacterium]
MACTRTLKLAFGALLLLASILAFDISSKARERGFSTIAGDGVKKRPVVSSKKYRNYRKLPKHLRRRGAGGTLHKNLFFFDGSELLRESRREEGARQRGHLRNKVSVMRSRPGAKIIRVSEKMKRLGEERAAKREARMLEELDNLDIRYYRDSEAYDARFPSIVYLDVIK